MDCWVALRTLFVFALLTLIGRGIRAAASRLGTTRATRSRHFRAGLSYHPVSRLGVSVIARKVISRAPVYHRIADGIGDCKRTFEILSIRIFTA